MKLKWVVVLALVVVIVFLYILPTYAPQITTKTVMRDSQAMAGDALVMVNQSDLAISMYDNALAANTSDPVILKKKGEALIKCGRAAEAGQVYRQVLTDNRNDTAAMVRVGDSFCSQGDYKGALTYYDQALAVDPGDSKTWMRKGDALMMMTAEDTKKLQDMAKGLSKQPGSAGYQPVSSDQVQSMDSYQKAMESYKKAMEIDPKLSVAISTRVLAATQNQVSSYESLMGAVQS